MSEPEYHSIDDVSKRFPDQNYSNKNTSDSDRENKHKCDRDERTISMEHSSMDKESKKRVENWVIKANRKLELDSTKSLRRRDSESCDSAFCGSEGNLLNSYDSKSRQKLKEFFGDVPRASTPKTTSLIRSETCRITRPHIENNIDISTSGPYPQIWARRHSLTPTPDYSVCSTPDGSARTHETFTTELSKILQEFEGNLNKHDQEPIDEETTERFYPYPPRRKFYSSQIVVHL